MSAEPLFHALTFDEWKNVTRILNYSEVKVLYYLLSQNPLGRNRIDCRVRTVAEEMGLSIGAVSKALKKLEAKGLIDEVTITRAEINIRPRLISDRAKEYLKKHDPNSEYLEPLVVSPSEQEVSPSEHPLYIKEFSRGNKEGGKDTTTATTENPTVQNSCFEEEQPEILDSMQEQDSDPHKKEDPSEEFNSAGDCKELLKEIDKVARDWKLRPWMASPTEFKPEIVKAVWQANPDHYSLRGTQTPNLNHIANTLRKLDGQLKQANATSIRAYRSLCDHWVTAQALTNPEVQVAFVAAAAISERQSEELKRQRRVNEMLEALEGL